MPLPPAAPGNPTSLQYRYLAYLHAVGLGLEDMSDKEFLATVRAFHAGAGAVFQILEDANVTHPDVEPAAVTNDILAQVKKFWEGERDAANN